MVHNYLSCASITEILLKSISVTKEIDSLYLAQSRQMDSSVFMDFVKYAPLRIFIFEESRSSHANHRHLFLIFNDSELKYTNSMGKIKIENIMYMYKYAHFAQYIAQIFFLFFCQLNTVEKV